LLDVAYDLLQRGEGDTKSCGNQAGDIEVDLGDGGNANAAGQDEEGDLGLGRHIDLVQNELEQQRAGNHSQLRNLRSENKRRKKEKGWKEEERNKRTRQN